LTPRLLRQKRPPATSVFSISFLIDRNWDCWRTIGQ
jgi:hypothetical protein